MFGKNEIVGQKYFENAGDKLFVTSIFYTLQGEGPMAGRPAVFVRFAKCNLACSFCDTYFDGGDWLTVDEVFDRAYIAMRETQSFRSLSDVGLVVTGGEPFLQKNLVKFIEKASNIFSWTQIETNGTVFQDIPWTTWVVCSPKCSEKNGKPVKYLTPHPKILERVDALKFVVSADPQSPYHDIPSWADDWLRDNNSTRDVFISPMNMYNSEPQRAKTLRSEKNDITIEERSSVDEVISFWEPGLLDMQANQLNHEYAAKLCTQRGYRLNLQMHLYCSLA